MAARRLKNIEPEYYWELYNEKIESLYFLIEHENAIGFPLPYVTARVVNVKDGTVINFQHLQKDRKQISYSTETSI